MACKSCASVNLQELAGELTASFLDIKGLDVSPIYVSQNIMVCLDCGFTHVVIPISELERLRKGRAASGS